MSRLDCALLATGLLALVARAMVDSGAPGGWFNAALTMTLLAAIAAAMSRARRWCDGPRALLVAMFLLDMSSVYGRIGGDGYEYYALLRSPIFDFDLDFANEYAGLGAQAVVTPGVGITSRVLVGQAIAWSPAFVVAHVTTLLSGVAPANGFSQPYQSAVTLASFVWAVLGLLLVESLLRSRYGRSIAALCVAGLWYATPLRFYATANASMSHATSAGVACLFVWLWLRGREQSTPGSWVAIGAAGALLALVRAQDAVLLAVPALDLLLRRPPDLVARALRFLAVPIAGAALQIGVWLAMYGTAFAEVTAEQNWVSTAGSNWMLVLFSPRHGLFTWHPLLLVATLGWLMLFRREGRLAFLCFVGLGLSAFVNGLLTDWWGSDAFGQRRLLCLLPLFGLGLGAVLRGLARRPLVAPALALVGLGIWNDQLSYIYNSEMVAGKDQGMTLDRLAPVQVDVAWRTIDRWKPWLPDAVWLFAYDTFKGVWLDDGPWSARGRLDLGGREAPSVAAALGEGWFPADPKTDSGFRTSRGRRSRLTLPIRHSRDATLIVVARAEPGHLGTRMRARLEGWDLGEQPLGPDWAEVRFAVPAGAITPGFNSLELVWSATARSSLPGWTGLNTAASVDSLRLVRE